MATKTRVNGDTFILCTFSIRYGPIVLDSGNDMAELLGKIPDHLDADETLCFCRVGHWTVDDDGDPTDWTPREVKTIFQIDTFDLDALDDDEDEC